MPNPRPINSTPPPPPTKLSYSASFKMNRKLRRLLFPLTRPAHIHPKKRVKWRLQQKWWNRYEKPHWIGRTLMAETKDGFRFTMEVTGVRRKKDGCHGFHLDIDSIPISHHGAEGMP